MYTNILNMNGSTIQEMLSNNCVECLIMFDYFNVLMLKMFLFFLPILFIIILIKLVLGVGKFLKYSEKS